MTMGKVGKLLTTAMEVSYFYLYYYLRGFPYLDSSFFTSKIPQHTYIYVETKLQDNPVKIQLKLPLKHCLKNRTSFLLIFKLLYPL